MNITVRTILLGLAVILFVLAVLIDDNWPDLIALGLAAFAAAYLIDDLGVTGRIGDRT
ncbi:MAG: hypothetical protein ICV64_07680 [Thermoleophilia bacterium]|nr:hypothetical protein [Thermoleophilia bacterium]